MSETNQAPVLDKRDFAKRFTAAMSAATFVFDEIDKIVVDY